MKPLTARDIETLNDLRAASDDARKRTGDGWVRPRDCGGSDNSHHSYTLTKLAGYGLCERWHYVGSCRYRINQKGREFLMRGSTVLTALNALSGVT